MSRPRHVLEAAALRSLLLAARLVPRRLLLFAGARAGDAGRRLDRRHTRIARENLRRAYGDAISDAEIERVVRECWRHFGRITFDALAFPSLSAADAGKVVRIEGIENLRAAYAKKKGVLLFSGHFGHWELAGLMQGHLGFPLAVIARPLDNPLLETTLAGLRTGSGNLVVHKRNAVRETLRALSRGLGVAIIIDQDARDDGVFVPFFGRPASTTPTLALVALRTGAPVLPVFSFPEPGGAWRVVYDPEVPVEATGDRDEDVRRLTATCTAIIERQVRERPELWLWMHRRWKTPPPAKGA